MLNLIIIVANLIIMIMMLAYVANGFMYLRYAGDASAAEDYGITQHICMYGIHFIASLILIIARADMKYLFFYIFQLALVIAIQIIYNFIYKNASQIVVNNMCMLMISGFIILTRLNYDKALRQYEIAVVAVVITAVVPIIVSKVHILQKLTWMYALVGLVASGIVVVAGSVSFGAKISLTIAGISIQPTEFIKILYVFFLACMFSKSTEFMQLAITSVVAGIQVLMLVAAKDLGAALIFFVVYLTMLYVATRRLLYFAGGICAGAVAAVLAYKVFSHVQTRVLAWKDPVSVIDNQGFQICQSLFSIGTGGWLGRGITKGSPKSIPVVEQDFVFSAIAEELGGIYAICIILICMICFIMFMNISMNLHQKFNKLVALGLGTVYGFQVFLTIGGVTKFIPSTGVTLPFVSYGGSSLLGTTLLFAIIQGMYIMREDGEWRGGNDTEKKKRSKGKKRTGFDTNIENL